MTQKMKRTIVRDQINDALRTQSTDISPLFKGDQLRTTWQTQEELKFQKATDLCFTTRKTRALLCSRHNKYLLN